MTDELEAPIPGGLRDDLRSPDPETRRLALLTLAEVKKDRKLLRVFIEVSQSDSDAEIRNLALRLAERYVDDVSGPIEIPKAGVAAVLLPPEQAGASAPSAEPHPAPAPVAAAASSRPPAPRFEDILASGETVPRIEAIRRVTASGDRTHLGLLRRQLEVETDLWVLATLLKAVGALGDSQDINQIQRFLKHDDLRVQANAIEALELIGDELSFALVSPMLNSGDARIRSNAIRCLMRFDSDEAFETLGRMARSEQEANRDSALYCMGLIQHPGIPALLVEMVAGETEDRLLAKEVALLAEDGGRDALGALASVRDKAGLELSEKAGRALSRCLERTGVPPEEIPRLKLEYESRQLVAGRLPGGPGGGGEDAGPDLPPLRSGSAPAPPDPAGEGAEAEPARVQEDLPRGLAEDLADIGRARRRKKKEDTPPPSTGEQLTRFVKENPATVGLFGLTLLFLSGSAMVLLSNLTASPPQPTRVAPIQVTRRPTRVATRPTREPQTRDDLVTLQCEVDHVDRRRKTALLTRDDERILALFDEAPPEDINKGDRVSIRGHFTGKERFGARYFRAVEMREN